jgi:hypothetical protein
MPGPYEVIIAAILLFPWTLVLTAVVGAVWPKARALARRARPPFPRTPAGERLIPLRDSDCPLTCGEK